MSTTITPGMADQYRAEARAARVALGFAIDSIEVAPSDITAAVANLKAQVATLTEAAEEDAEFTSAIIKAICDHVGLDPDPEGYTTEDLESLLEEHNDEIDRVYAESKASKALAGELASEMVRAHTIIRYFNQWHSDPGADTLASERVTATLITKARAAGLLPADATKGHPADTKAVLFGAPAGLHPNTLTLIADFASALATKLRASEVKYGWTANWMRKGWRDDLVAELLRHVHKGDPVDVAAYCAFAWFHGWDVTPAAPPVAEISPSMCVAASDAATSIGVNLPASQASVVICAALNTGSASDLSVEGNAHA